MKKYNLLALLYMFFITGMLKAQTSVPVNLNTGQPIINIPIYIVTSGNLAIPVSLYYTPGIPANEQYGSDNFNIGVGWGVSAGGSITRAVRGLPDDFQGAGTDTRQGWLYGSTASTLLTWAPTTHTTNCTSDQVNYGTLVGFTASNADTEPDVFNFNFGGYSGQFVFDNNKIIQTLPYQDIKIQPTFASNGSIAQFTITTDNGVQYHFVPTTTVTISLSTVPAGTSNNVLYLRDKLVKYALNTTYTTTWSLDGIIAPSGASIGFNYGPPDSSQVSTPTHIFLANGTLGTTYTSTLYNVNTKYKVSNLSSITGASTNISVTYNSDGSVSNFQANATGFAISSSVLFTTTLNYQTFNNRKYLLSVQTSNNCVKNPPYLFNYIGVNYVAGSATLPTPTLQQGVYCPSICYLQPQVNQYQTDYWGYYNANGASTYCPNLYVYPNLPMADRYRLEQIPNYTGTYNYIGGGADRRVNPAAITAGTLNLITFPTGGSVKIGYQCNQYFDATANQTFNGGGIRVDSVTVHDGINTANDIIKTYTYGTGLLVNKPQYAFPIPVYTDASGAQHSITQYGDEPTQTEFFMARTENDLNPYSFDSPNVIYQSATEIQTGKGKTVYTYATPATYGATTSPEYAAPYTWAATYSRYASTTNPSTGTCMSLGMAADGYYGFPFAANSNYTFERGLLQKVQMYSETGQLVKEKDYTYTPIYQGTAPGYIYGLASDFFTYSRTDIGTRIYNYGKYALFAGINKFQTSVKETAYDPISNYTTSISTQTNFNYTSVNHTLLSNVTATSSNDGVNFTSYITRYKYPQDYAGSLSGADSATTAILALQNNAMYNTIIENTSSIVKPGQTEQITGAGLTVFKVFNSNNLTRALPYKAFSLKTNIPLSNFTQASVNGSNQFAYDGRYVQVNGFTDYNNIGNLFSENDGHHNLSGILYDHSGTVPIAKIRNATANQVVYSNFEDETPSTLTGPTVYSFDHALNGHSAYNLVAGRVGVAISVIPNFTFQKAGVTKGVGGYYVFSCWVNTTTAGNMTVTLTDNSGNSVPAQVIPYTNITGVWTYYKINIPVTNLVSVINISAITNVAVSIDDLLFYPGMAQVSLTSYQNYQKIAETDAYGNTKFITNDAMGRPTLVTDQNQNILKRMIYNYNVAYTMNAGFIMPPSALLNSVVSFKTGPADGCEPPGIVRNWAWGDGTSTLNGGTNPVHTYMATGTYQVTLTVTSSIYGTVSSTQIINIQQQQLTFSLSACGIVSYEVCSGSANAYGNSGGVPCGTTLPVGTNTFTATTLQDCTTGGSNYIWQMAYDTAPTTWIALQSGATNNTCTVQLPLNAQGSVNVNQSYTLMCTIAPHCSAQSSSQTYHISYFAASCSHQ